jgi:hypothetical protein
MIKHVKATGEEALDEADELREDGRVLSTLPSAYQDLLS